MNTINYDELTPGIRNTVLLLRLAGFHTSDSGDGVTNVAAGMEGALEVPHVHCVVDAALLIGEAHRLHRVMMRNGCVITPGMIQATYDPADQSATLSLYGVDDAMLGGRAA